MKLVLKAEDIVSKQDIIDSNFGKIVMAIGIGALFGEKLRKVAKYLIIGGALIQVPVSLRITKKAFKFAKQIKQMKEEKAVKAEEQQAGGDTPESEPKAAVEPAEVVADGSSDPKEESTDEPVQAAPDLDHLKHPCEPASHPHEDPND